MPTLQERIDTAVTAIEADKGTLHSIIHGLATETVTTDGGPVKTLAKAVADLEATYEATLVLTTTLAYMNNANLWATEAEDTQVNDGTNPVGYSAYHYALKCAASAASAALSETAALAATVGKYNDKISISVADSPYTVPSLTLDTLITVDTSGGDVVINLPASSGEDDKRLLGINKAAAANTITVNADGTNPDTVGGLSSFVMYDATEWFDLTLDQANADWLMGNISFTSAGAGLQKAGSTISVAMSGILLSMLADAAKPFDVAFIAGFDGTMTAEDLAVQTYGETVMSRAGSFTGEAGYIDTPGTGASVIVDVLKNGTSIYTTPPQFDAAANAITTGTLKTDGTEDFVAHDRITFKVTQIGSTVAGGGLRFTAKTVLV